MSTTAVGATAMAGPALANMAAGAAANSTTISTGSKALPKWVVLVATVLFGAARVVLGGLWLHEGLFKLGAHFGRADILLVADGASGSGTRVPGYFGIFADHVLRVVPGLFGVMTPLMEITLGMALIVGVLTLPVAATSLLTLMMYWSSDQLVAQYPVMGVLSVLVILGSVWATRVSLTTVLLAKWQRAARFVGTPLQRWL